MLANNIFNNHSHLRKLCDNTRERTIDIQKLKYRESFGLVTQNISFFRKYYNLVFTNWNEAGAIHNMSNNYEPSCTNWETPWPIGGRGMRPQPGGLGKTSPGDGSSPTSWERTRVLPTSVAPSEITFLLHKVHA